MDTNKLLTGNIYKPFAKYVSLNILSMIGLSCYILADTFFIANGVGAGPDGFKPCAARLFTADRNGNAPGYGRGDALCHPEGRRAAGKGKHNVYLRDGGGRGTGHSIHHTWRCVL